MNNNIHMASQIKRTENMYPCPGSNRVTDARNWFVPPGKNTSECTICEECFDKYLKDKPEAKDFGEYSHLESCNCDYDIFFDKSGLEIDGVKITITNAKTGEKFAKLDDSMANLNAVVHFVLPTCTEYVINVNNLNGNYLTFESGLVGEKKIVINGGKKIYYPSDIKIRGFETGSNESFMFISPSNREKCEGYNIEGENITNIIKLKLKRWKRESNECYSQTRFNDCRFDDECYGYRGSTFSLASCSNKSLSGGATISGGSYVDNVKTTTTTDKFTQIGDEIELVIQLVCDQDESEKYETNKKYHLKKDFDQRRKLLTEKEKIELEISSLKKKLDAEEKKLDEVEIKLRKYEYLGSDDKPSYLIQF